MILRSRRNVEEDPNSATAPDTLGTHVYWLINGHDAGAENLVANTAHLPPGTRHQLHRHPHAEQLTIVVSGRGVHLTESDKTTVEAGDVVLVPAGEWHGFTNPFQDEVVIVNIYGGVREREDAGYELFHGAPKPAENSRR